MVYDAQNICFHRFTQEKNASFICNSGELCLFLDMLNFLTWIPYIPLSADAKSPFGFPVQKVQVEVACYLQILLNSL